MTSELTNSAGSSIRKLNAAKRRASRRGLVPIMAILFAYVLTGPVVEAVHAEPADRSHACAICAQMTERHTTAPVTFDLSPPARVSLISTPHRIAPPHVVRHLSRHKRGPPDSRSV